jgi:hypothetical protein
MTTRQEASKMAHIHNLSRDKKINGKSLIHALNQAFKRHGIMWENPYGQFKGDIVDELFQGLDFSSREKPMMSVEEFFDIVAEDLQDYVE